jgi:hypothetical protein
MHQALLLLGHFGMKHTGACCHPLHVSGSDNTLFARMVAVTHASSLHVGNRLMWMLTR